MTQQRVSPISVTSVLPAVPVLSLQAALGQSANLTEWKNSSGTIVAGVSASGAFGIARTAGTGVSLIVSTGAAANVGLMVDGVASQTGDLQQWRNSAGTTLAFVEAGGQFRAGSMGINGTSFGISYFRVSNLSTDPGSTTMAIRAVASQSGNLFQAQMSDGTVRTRIDQFGTFMLGTATGNYGAWLNIQPALVNDKGIVVRGAASQSANLQEWQNSAGTVLSYINNAGQIGVPQIYSRYYVNTTNVGAYLDLEGISNSATIFQRVTGAVGLIVRGAASQTANLQEWQNSAGTVLARITSGGVIQGPTQTINAYVRLQEESSGGSIQITKLTAQAGSPGTSNGVLYFRDGTNAGTLKLVVRAGSAGAETTILDNIPQT